MPVVVWVAVLCETGWELSKRVHAVQSEQKTEGAGESKDRLRQALAVFGMPQEMLPPTA